MGSQVQHRVGAAQNKPENTAARETIGQHKSTTAAELPKLSQKTSPRGSLMGSQVQHRGEAAQSKP